MPDSIDPSLVFGKTGGPMFLNISGAGSRFTHTGTTAPHELQLGNLSLLSELGHEEPPVPFTATLSNGGVLDHPRIRFDQPESDSESETTETGRIASGLLRTDKTLNGPIGWELFVDPCVNLAPGDKFVLMEYTVTHSLELSPWWTTDTGTQVSVADGGLADLGKAVVTVALLPADGSKSIPCAQAKLMAQSGLSGRFSTNCTQVPANAYLVRAASFELFHRHGGVVTQVRVIDNSYGPDALGLYVANLYRFDPTTITPAAS
jgi:hypothetical protein